MNLPEPTYFAPQMITEDCYNAGQLLAAVEKERERCARICEDEARLSFQPCSGLGYQKRPL